MRIAIDITQQHGSNIFRGVGAYTRLLHAALQKLHSEHTFTLVTDGQIPPDTALVHYPYFDLYFRTLTPPPGLPYVVTVHDVIPLRFANHYWPGFRGLIKKVFQVRALKNAAAVLTDSHTSKTDIHELLEIANPKIHTVYLAADPELVNPGELIKKQVLQKYNVQQPYFLYVGDINYNKNIPALIRAFSHLEANDYSLVLVSRALAKREVPEAHIIFEAIRHSGLQDRITILSKVPLKPKSELAAIYAGAHWYIQPSLYEGFGLPVLESMQCGVPVISSNGGSLKELADTKTAIMFQPESEEQLLKAMKSALHYSEAGRNALITAGTHRSQQFSWQITAKETLAVYEKAKVSQ